MTLLRAAAAVMAIVTVTVGLALIWASSDPTGAWTYP